MLARLSMGLALARIVLNVVIGVLIVALLFPFINQIRRQRLIAWWARGVLAICGVHLRVTGAVQAGSGVMLLLNHISWLDIYVVNAVAPARFVAKSEIGAWPVFGYLARRTGTVFIERGRRHAVHRTIDVLTQLLRTGGRVGVFPEGTSGDGSKLLPFHANLIEAALHAGVDVQPVALSYRNRDGSRCHGVAFVGEMTLLDSMRASLAARPIDVQLDFLAPIDCAGRSRHQVAALARDAIGLHLGLRDTTSDGASRRVQ